MKKLIMMIAVAACLALCTAVWPQREVVEEILEPTQGIAVNTPETPALAPGEETEVLPQAEKENGDPLRPELPAETGPEPEPTPAETPMILEALPTPEPEPASETNPDSAPAQTVAEPQPGNMVYVEGFGWLESQGEGAVIYDDMIYENGNKVGSMG